MLPNVMPPLLSWNNHTSVGRPTLHTTARWVRAGTQRPLPRGSGQVVVAEGLFRLPRVNELLHSLEKQACAGGGTCAGRTRPHGITASTRALVTLAARLTGKTAAEIISAMLAVFGRIDPHLRRSITFDNDTAFAQHGMLRTMRDMTTWFCDAYASWQKGGIENANGRLRRWLPRHLDIDRTSDQDIQEIVLTTNLTPRKCLGFKTPFQALIAELGKDVQIRFS